MRPGSWKGPGCPGQGEPGGEGQSVAQGSGRAVFTSASGVCPFGLFGLDSHGHGLCGLGLCKPLACPGLPMR